MAPRFSFAPTWNAKDGGGSNTEVAGLSIRGLGDAASAAASDRVKIPAIAERPKKRIYVLLSAASCCGSIEINYQVSKEH